MNWNNINIPLLHEVFEILPKKCFVNIEIKSKHFYSTGIEKNNFSIVLIFMPKISPDPIIYLLGSTELSKIIVGLIRFNASSFLSWKV